MAELWLDVVPMCILTPKTLNMCGLILSFIGAVMLFIRFLAHLIRASGRPIWQSWFVRWCGRLGIALITIGFLLQLVAKFSQ
jgi:NADH:ubiquinone oxidoreductase subunit 6 (subunit J)